MDWIDTNMNSIIDITDESYEIWYDNGVDNTADSLEFLQIPNYLTLDIVHDINSYIEYSGESLAVDSNEIYLDDSKDINVWISDIVYDLEEDKHQAIINFKINAPTKAIEFDFLHLPYIFLDSVYNQSTNIFYGSSQDTLVSDRSEYSFETLSEQELQNIILDYSQGIETNIHFDLLNDFITQDSTLSVNTEYSNLYIHLNDRSNFNEGFSDIYYKGVDSDIFLKRVYFDDDSRIEIPIGNLIQQFIDKTLEYNGINLRLSGGGYNFNRLDFHKYSDDNWDNCGSSGCSDSLNPKIEIMYSK